eukprot:3101045-Pyramimonas_sp.AAC.1
MWLTSSGNCSGEFGGPVVESATNLGIDDTVGRPRRTRNRAKKFTIRLHRFKKQTSKLRGVGQTLGRYAKRIFVSGTLPCIEYGAAVHGISDREAHLIRQSAGKVLRPQAAGRSLTSLMILED